MNQRISRASTFSAASKEFRRYRHVRTTGDVETVAAGSMPLPYWPDGRWCLEVALYLESKSKLSSASRGGSYTAIAYTLSELTRFCFNNGIGFLELTESYFCIFMSGLAAPELRSDGRFAVSRSPNRIIVIGRQALAFLDYVSDFFGRTNFVGKQGTVKGEMKPYSIPPKGRGEKPIIKYAWHHDAFPAPSPIDRRHPIGDEYVSKLRKAVLLSTSKPFLRQRRLLLIRLLDSTGARRIELANLTVASVRSAQAMVDRGEAPFLLLPTFKKRGGPRQRLLPIDEVLLTALVDFIEIFRAPIVSKLKRDCPFVLVSVKGTQLQANTITLEIFLLRKLAGIVGKAHPHLFRHRYICRRLVELIATVKVTDTASMIAYLLHQTAAQTKLLEETGQASIQSLKPYIDDVFMAKRHPEKTVQGDDLSRLSASVKTSVDELKALQGNMPAEELLSLALASYSAYSSALNRPQ